MTERHQARLPSCEPPIAVCGSGAGSDRPAAVAAGMRYATLLAGVSAVVLLAAGAASLMDAVTGSRSHAGATVQGRSRAEIVEACNEHVRQAAAEANASVERRSREFSQFVQNRKAGAGLFAESLVSWHGHWRVIKAYLPFTDPDGHRKFVEEKFAEHLFSAEEIGGVVGRIVTESAKDIEGVENRLAVKIKREIAGGGTMALDESMAVREFGGAVADVVTASRWDAAKTVGSLATSEVVAVVGTNVLARLGVSAGLLGSGAASSTWTLGVGIVLGLVADLLWEWIDDPAGDIERETVLALERLAADGSAALRDELGAVVTERRKLWEQAVQEMVP